MRSTYIQRAEYAVDLGATISEGINWTWANYFPTAEMAREFISAFPDMETRGMYPEPDGSYSVRFR